MFNLIYNYKQKILNFIFILQKIKYYLNQKTIYQMYEESEKLRSESKTLMENAQKKLNTADTECKKIIDQAKKDSENLIIEMNEKFHKSSEIKKNLTEIKINQMKEAAINEIKFISIKIAIDSVKQIISTSVDKSKLDNLFKKNLEEVKTSLKNINV